MTIEKRRLAGMLVLLLAAVLVFGTVSCAAESTQASQTSQQGSPAKWYNYDIKNNPLYSTVGHTFAAKDNFYAYANAQDILQGTPSAWDEADYQDYLDSLSNRGQNHAGSSRLDETSKLINGLFDTLSQDPSITGTEADVVRTMYTMMHDADTRERLGVTPVLPAIEEIRKISTLDELTTFISSGGKSSLKEAFVRELVMGNPQDGTVMLVTLYPHEFVLIDSALYKDMTEENVDLYLYLLNNFHTFLMKCGYSEKEADDTVIALATIETKLASAINGNSEFIANILSSSDVNNPEYAKQIMQLIRPTYDDLCGMVFPFAADLKDYHDAGVDTYQVIYPNWMNQLNELYTPEHLEEFKALLLYNLYMTATPFLDDETKGMFFNKDLLEKYPYMPQMNQDNQLFELESKLRRANPDIAQDVLKTYLHSLDLDQYLDTVSVGDVIDYDHLAELIREHTGKTAEELLPSYAAKNVDRYITEAYLGMALAKVICDAKIPAGEKEKYTAFIQEIIAAFKDRLMNADWLSPSTREAALDKLSKLKIRVLYPDDWSYYSYNDVKYQDAESLYDLSVLLRKHNQALLVKNSIHAPSATIWPNMGAVSGSYHLPQTVNAFYSPQDNSINLLYGFVAGLMNDSSLSMEDLYAIVGTTIAHEITHGFDPNGSQYDGNGTKVNWWTENDRANFDEKMDKIAAYFSKFEALPGVYLNGNIMTGEATADFGGLSTILDMARTIDDFDYDTFFTAFAQGLYQPKLLGDYASLLSVNPHPPGMYRMNTDVQQYDEFYTTYDVNPEDAMYLAPENRLTVW